MTSMIERIAKRIYEQRNGAGCKPWSRIGKAHQEPYLGDAKAALHVVRPEALACVPGNWCDALLTGPNALIDKSPAPEIENLLNAVRARMESALKETP